MFLSNLPMGVYFAGHSPAHRLRARTKLLLLIWLAGMFFLANHKMFHFGVYAVAFALLALALFTARVSVSYIWRRMRLLVVLLLIGVPFSLMWTPGNTWRTLGPLIVDLRRIQVTLSLAGRTLDLHNIHFPLGPIVVTYDGIWLVFSFSSIFLLLYLGSMLLTLTTTPVALAEGMALLLRPLKRLRLPVEEFGLMTLVALRFLPVLMQEAEQLLKAQMSRGADFTTGSPVARAQRLSTLLAPLAQGALRRAEGLSAALESRGYGVTGTATLLHEGRLGWGDWLALVSVPALTLLAYWKL